MADSNNKTAYELHVEAMRKAFDVEDFGLMNILSNRMMADSLIWDDKQMGIVGFYFKNAALYFMRGSSMIRSSTSTERGKSSLIKESAKIIFDSKILQKYDDFTTGESVEMYVQFRNKIRSALLNDIERSSYKENKGLTKDALTWLNKYLSDNKKILLLKENKLFSGVINEADRAINLFGGLEREILFVLLLTAIEWIYEYYEQTYRKSDKDAWTEMIESIFYPYVERLNELYEEKGFDKDQIANDIFNLVKKWRSLFINYMENSQVKMNFIEEKPEESVELPEDLKKELRELMTRKVREELKLK
ncbi:MAG: hypothetical protein M1290_04540 [Candidatus Thermoplasmatota archaeon]|jgi:hypothetical protein|nr:hypothetical protein [Candidatus Thermoplasmatota archaeon]